MKMAIFIVAILLFSSFVGIGDYKTSNMSPSTISNDVTICLDDNITEDQKQDREDAYMKLYKGIYLAQTFTCNKDTLTGVAIKIGKYMRNSFSSSSKKDNTNSKVNSFKNNLLRIISKSKILSRFLEFLNRFGKATSLDVKSGP